MPTTNLTALPNPFTPMAYVVPSLAVKITNQKYVAVGSLAVGDSWITTFNYVFKFLNGKSQVLLWDTITYLHEDYKLATGYQINLSFIIYCIARVASLTYLMGLVVLTTIPIGNCDYIHYITILYPFTIPLAILPFVTRIAALYRNNKFIIAFFSTTWLTVLASCIYVPIGTSGERIGDTMYCVEFKTKISNELQVICPFIHDSLIFAATSRAFMKFSYEDATVKNSMRVIFLGWRLPRFSKIILRDGQLYYLATLIMSVFFIVLANIPKRPVTPCAVSYLAFVVLNVMSSYVYRNIRLGYYRDFTISSSMVDRALQNSQTSQHRDIVFELPPVSTKPSEDLEAGDSDVVQTEVKVVLDVGRSTDSEKMGV